MFEEIYQSILNFEDALIKYQNEITLDNKKAYFSACEQTAKMIKSSNEELPQEMISAWDRIVFIVNGLESTSKTFAKIRTPAQMNEYTRAQLIMITGEVGVLLKAITNANEAPPEPEKVDADEIAEQSSPVEESDEFVSENTSSETKELDTKPSENVQVITAEGANDTDNIESVKSIETYQPQIDKNVLAETDSQNAKMVEGKNKIQTVDKKPAKVSKAVSKPQTKPVKQPTKKTETKAPQAKEKVKKPISQAKPQKTVKETPKNLPAQPAPQAKEKAKKPISQAKPQKTVKETPKKSPVQPAPPTKKIVKKIIKKVVQKPLSQETTQKEVTQTPVKKKIVKKIIRRVIKK